MWQVVTDIECNKCHTIYQNTDRGMSILVNNTYLSICPKCTKEVAEMMGFTSENITKHFALIKKANTKRNFQNELEQGERCFKCERKFTGQEPRVRESTASNVKSWHVQCYE